MLCRVLLSEMLGSQKLRDFREEKCSEMTLQAVIGEPHLFITTCLYLFFLMTKTHLLTHSLLGGV